MTGHCNSIGADSQSMAGQSRTPELANVPDMLCLGLVELRPPPNLPRNRKSRINMPEPIYQIRNLRPQLRHKGCQSL